MSLPSNRDLARAALYAGLLAGALDIAAAILQNLQLGEHAARLIFQSVATGWLGVEAYEGGWTTAWLGLASHFAIMLVIAALYVALAAVRPHLRTRWIGAGLAWGGVVWVAMAFIVVPLSNSPIPPPSGLKEALIAAVTHMVAVGLPMAWIARRLLGPGQRSRPAQGSGLDR